MLDKIICNNSEVVMQYNHRAYKIERLTNYSVIYDRIALNNLSAELFTSVN